LISPRAFVHPSAVIENDVEIQDNVKVWHFCHVREHAVIEHDVSLGKDVYIDIGVRVGHHTRIQNGVSVFQGLKISPWGFVGPHVIFTNDPTPRVGSIAWHIVPTRLETGMSIGAGAIIRCGVTIGAFAMIGAGAIVTKDVPPFHLAIGFPAQCHQMVCACGRTFLPIASRDSELVRDCCVQNLVPELLTEAHALMQQRRLS
jgi:acyl-[acyl carrier protein]--UDP-N-acetylglucosamine O-acyltransferase